MPHKFVIRAMAIMALTYAYACAQSPSLGPLVASPPVLEMGRGPLEIMVHGRGLPSGLVARWNGSQRPTSTTESFNEVHYAIRLSAEDLARPSLGHLTFVDEKTGALYRRSSFVPIVYAVRNVGTAFDAARNRLFIATAPESNDAKFPGNSVIALDVLSGAIGPIWRSSHFLSGIALSEDASTLWAVVDGDSRLSRLETVNLTQVSEFRFRPPGTNIPGFGFGFRSAVAVMPGKPGTIALIYGPMPGLSAINIAVFDEGTKRPREFRTDGFEAVLFSRDGQYLFAGSYSRFNVGESFARFVVDSSGLPEQQPRAAKGGAPVQVLDGKLYTSKGTIVDIESMELTGEAGLGYATVADPVNKRLLVVYGREDLVSTDPEFLHAFDLETTQPLGAHGIGAAQRQDPRMDETVRLYRFGIDGLIYRTFENVLIFRSPLAAPAPSTHSGAIINAASAKLGPIAPGEIVSIYGTNLGPEVPESFTVDSKDALLPLASQVEVWFDSLPGTVLMASQGQINVIAPFGLAAGRDVRLQVWRFGIPSPRVPVVTTTAAPAFFTRNGSGTGLASVVNQDGSINTTAPRESIISLYGTGGGVTQDAVDGNVARAARSLLQEVKVFIGGQEAKVWYAGAAPGLPHGVFQVNAQIPGTLSSNSTVPIIIRVNGKDSPEGINVQIR